MLKDFFKQETINLFGKFHIEYDEQRLSYITKFDILELTFDTAFLKQRAVKDYFKFNCEYVYHSKQDFRNEFNKFATLIFNFLKKHKPRDLYFDFEMFSASEMFVRCIALASALKDYRAKFNDCLTYEELKNKFFEKYQNERKVTLF